MTSQDRQQFWQQHIGAWQASGLSGAAFCKQRDLNYAQFNYWRKKFRATEAVEKPAGFAQVRQLADSPSHFNDGLSIHLPSGISFSRVNAGNLDVILALLRQL
jgi:hypothetical protein